jgi:predicted branched-subunit amino acid permease
VPPLKDFLDHRAFGPLFGSPGALAASRRQAFADGLRDYSPAMIATGAWSVVTAVTTVKMGLDIPHALAMNILVYAASAQLAALPLIVGGAPAWLILLTATIVNLRFVIFSAGLHPFFKEHRLSRRLVLGYLTSDLGYLLAIRRWTAGGNTEEGRTADQGLTERTWYYLGLGAGNWLTWVSMAVLGTLLADRVPAAWGLDFVGVLALTAVVMPSIADKPSVVGAIVAGAVSVLARAMPLKLAVLAAVVAGVAAAIATEQVSSRGRP